MSKSAKNVVVVGGGAAGVTIARLLSVKLGALGYNLILINSRPFNVHLIATIRMTVTDVDQLENTAILPFDKVFSNGVGSVKIGTVASIVENDGSKGGVVALTDGETIPYEILVLTPGSLWSDNLSLPNDKQSLTEHIGKWRHKFESAQDIVLAGGGSIAIETAGEIKDCWPNKNVTIVHGGNSLLNDTYPAKFRNGMAKALTDRGVKIIYDDYLDDFPTEGVTSIATRNGKKLKADLVVATTGPRPNTAFISSLGSDVLTKRGTIIVQPTLQLPSHPNIYAAGDAIEWAEQKQAAKVGGHAAVVVANIISIIQGKSAATQYKGAPEMILVTNGKNGGMAYLGILWGITLGAWFARMMKSKDLLIPMARKGVGLA